MLAVWLYLALPATGCDSTCAREEKGKKKGIQGQCLRGKHFRIVWGAQKSITSSGTNLFPNPTCEENDIENRIRTLTGMGEGVLLGVEGRPLMRIGEGVPQGIVDRLVMRTTHRKETLS